MCCYKGDNLQTGLSSNVGFLYNSNNLNDIIYSGYLKSFIRLT